jgi:MFS family permease
MADEKFQVMDPHVDDVHDHNGERTPSVVDDAVVAKITKTSSVIMVLISGLALFSDGYNAQIIGYMNPLFKELYPDAFTPIIKTRLSNAYLIGEIFGMLFFGFLIDKMGRRTGIFFATVFLILGIIIATAAHGTNNLGMFWMMIIGRGVAGFGAGGISFSPKTTVTFLINVR